MILWNQFHMQNEWTVSNPQSTFQLLINCNWVDWRTENCLKLDEKSTNFSEHYSKVTSDCKQDFGLGTMLEPPQKGMAIEKSTRPCQTN